MSFISVYVRVRFISVQLAVLSGRRYIRLSESSSTAPSCSLTSFRRLENSMSSSSVGSPFSLSGSYIRPPVCRLYSFRYPRILYLAWEMYSRLSLYFASRTSAGSFSMSSEMSGLPGGTVLSFTPLKRALPMCSQLFSLIGLSYSSLYLVLPCGFTSIMFCLAFSSIGGRSVSTSATAVT